MGVHGVHDWIPIEEMEEGQLYYCSGRNFSIGMWDGIGLVYVRNKFGHRFLDTEFHWDDGPPYGTAKPLQRLADMDDLDDDLDDMLRELMEKLDDARREQEKSV